MSSLISNIICLRDKTEPELVSLLSLLCSQVNSRFFDINPTAHLNFLRWLLSPCPTLNFNCNTVEKRQNFDNFIFFLIGSTSQICIGITKFLDKKFNCCLSTTKNAIMQYVSLLFLICKQTKYIIKQPFRTKFFTNVRLFDMCFIPDKHQLILNLEICSYLDTWSRDLITYLQVPRFASQSISIQYIAVFDHTWSTVSWSYSLFLVPF